MKNNTFSQDRITRSVMPTMQQSVQFFDPDSEVTMIERRLPHWSQAGTICFITWRTDDSMPTAILDAWFRERGAWLEAKGINVENPAWKDSLQKLGSHVVRQFNDVFWNRWHDRLDESHGSCLLKDPQIAAEVANSLHCFDGQRYTMFDFVVMPNHVHILAAFHDEQGLLSQCESWKHFTARQINRLTGKRGRFWQQDSFDHLVRSEQQFAFLRRYIAENPVRAKLRDGEFLHYSQALGKTNKVLS